MEITYTYRAIGRGVSYTFQSNMRRTRYWGRDATATIAWLALLPAMGVIRIDTPLLMIGSASPVALKLVVFFWGRLVEIEKMGRCDKSLWILLRIVGVYPQSSRTGSLFSGIVEVGCVWDIVIVPVSELWDMASLLLQPTH